MNINCLFTLPYKKFNTPYYLFNMQIRINSWGLNKRLTLFISLAKRGGGNKSLCTRVYQQHYIRFFGVFDPINLLIDDGYAVFYGCYQFRVWVWITPDSSLDVVSWQPTHIVVLEFYLECNYVSRAIPVPSTHSQHEKCALQQFHAVSAVILTAVWRNFYSDTTWCRPARPSPPRRAPSHATELAGGRGVYAVGPTTAGLPSLLPKPRRPHSSCNLTKTEARRHLSSEI